MLIGSLGKKRRLEKMFNKEGRTIIIPVDDLLIFGAKGYLKDYDLKIPQLKKTPVNAILGFPGVFKQFYSALNDKTWIMNLTVSTVNSDHTNKKLALTIENAISMGADAVAVHVNITSPTEIDMITNLGNISCACNMYGIPIMAIMYARKPGSKGDDNYEALKRDDENAYSNLIAHACRIAVEIGVDIIKTNFTGSSNSFKNVIKAAGGVPVVIAGGEKVSKASALKMASDAIKAGASGVCFGRNTFSRKNVVDFINMLSKEVYKK